MDCYKNMYLVLFNAVTDALSALDQQNFGLAAQALRRAQWEAEELYLGVGEEPTP